MELAIEILQEYTTPWLRILILLMVLLFILVFRSFRGQRKNEKSKENIKDFQDALRVKKLMLEIEMMEKFLKHDSPKQEKDPNLKLLKETNQPEPLLPTIKLYLPLKVFYGLLGSLLFLMIVLLLNGNISHDTKSQYTIQKLLQDFLFAIIVGIGVAFLPGNKSWEYFVYGLGLPILLVFLMTNFSD